MPVEAPESRSGEDAMPALHGHGMLSGSGSRRALAGFFVSGLLLGFVGAILLSWGYHLGADYDVIALYFAGVIAGLGASTWVAPRLLETKGVAWTLAFACGLAAIALLYLAVVSPPVGPWWRVAGLTLLGASAGVLHTAIFQAISPMYKHNPAATVNLAGVLFGLGSLTVAGLISAAYYGVTVATLQAALALIPAGFAWMYWTAKFPTEPVPHQPPTASVFGALRNPGAVLLALLLFFQLGNEWAVAGWLALFLSQRLGISPSTALSFLALYWLALLIGRVVAQWVLPRIRHSRLLLGCVVAAMFGSLVVSATNNEFGAVSGILMLGGAFAPIYPLVVERIGRSFPYYHPGFYNGLFSFALAGGLLAPCTLGIAASLWGVGMVMTLPMIGSVIVFVLLVLSWLETRLSAHVPREKP